MDDGHFCLPVDCRFTRGLATITTSVSVVAGVDVESKKTLVCRDGHGIRF